MTDMPNWIHPAAILVLGSFLIPLFKGRVRQAYILLLPALAFLSVATMDYGTYGVYNVLGIEMTFGRVDRLSYVFAGSATGLAFAGDYLTLFLFAEFMALGSMCLVLFRKTDESTRAAYRYILMHIFSGVCVLGGALLQYQQTGSFAFDHVTVGGLAAGLLLIGFMTNAAVPPFSAWLTDAYPLATIPGAVFMSSFTTKSAVYTLARGFAGTDMLIVFGVIMAVYGTIYAILENDIRRLPPPSPIPG